MEINFTRPDEIKKDVIAHVNVAKKRDGKFKFCHTCWHIDRSNGICNAPLPAFLKGVDIQRPVMSPTDGADCPCHMHCQS